MKLTRQGILEQAAIIKNTRIEDVADFDGKTYTIKDMNSPLNIAIQSMTIRKGKIVGIKMSNT